MDDTYSICFVIALKYVRNYVPYINIHINNINRFYKNSHILIVDNNSENLEDIIYSINSYPNVKIITNTSESKYEVGAYIFGINWLIQNNMINMFELFVFTQDTLIMINKFDFNILINNRIDACSIVEYENDYDMNGNRYLKKEMDDFLSPIGLNDDYTNITLCWGNNFVCRQNKILTLFGYIKNMILKTKMDSESSERFMAKIIYELNSKRNFNIDGFLPKYEITHDQSSNTHIDNMNKKVYFLKKHQFKA
jgi:hypothetical protein